MITVLTIIVDRSGHRHSRLGRPHERDQLSTAQNQISAFISNARADAIYNRQTIGVFFYLDPKTQQTAMAEVQVQTLYQQILTLVLRGHGLHIDTSGREYWSPASSNLESLSSPSPNAPELMVQLTPWNW